MSYTLLNVTKDGAQLDISSIVPNYTWSGDVREAARKLELDLVYGRDSFSNKYIPPLGSIIILRSEIELFRGIVWDVSKGTKGSAHTLCYDHAIYLTNNMSTYKFTNTSPEAMITKICGDFGISIGTLAPTGVTLSKLIVRDYTLYDMVVAALTEASKRNGKKYHLIMREGKLNTEEKGQQVLRWLITEGQNLIDASTSESLSDMRNRVVIVGDKDQVLADIKDDALIQQYGLLQEYKRESDITSGEAQTMARNLLKDLAKISQSLDISAIGIDDVIAGQSIEVQETLTGIVGQYYVLTDSHKYANGVHTMSLVLSLETVVAEKEGSKDEQ